MGPIVGFHFRVEFRIDFTALYPLMSGRLAAMGLPPAEKNLRPQHFGCVVSGTRDLRLESGGLRYDVFAWPSLAPDDVGVVHPNFYFRCGIEEGCYEDCSDTCTIRPSGLYLPKTQGDAVYTGDESIVPILHLAPLDLWQVLDVFALQYRTTSIALPPSNLFPGWELQQVYANVWVLQNTYARIILNVENMISR